MESYAESKTNVEVHDVYQVSLVLSEQYRCIIRYTMQDEKMVLSQDEMYATASIAFSA